MSDQDNLALFGDRVARLSSTRDAKQRHGIVCCARQKRSRRTWLPLGRILGVLAICVVLKAFAIAYLSEGTYRTHLLYFDQTNMVESLLAAALAPDPLSLKLSRHLPL